MPWNDSLRADLGPMLSEVWPTDRLQQGRIGLYADVLEKFKPEVVRAAVRRVAKSQESARLPTPRQLADACREIARPDESDRDTLTRTLETAAYWGCGIGTVFGHSDYTLDVGGLRCPEGRWLPFEALTCDQLRAIKRVLVWPPEGTMPPVAAEVSRASVCRFLSRMGLTVEDAQEAVSGDGRKED